MLKLYNKWHERLEEEGGVPHVPGEASVAVESKEKKGLFKKVKDAIGGGSSSSKSSGKDDKVVMLVDGDCCCMYVVDWITLVGRQLHVKVVTWSTCTVQLLFLHGITSSSLLLFQNEPGGPPAALESSESESHPETKREVSKPVV